jgi:Fic family protein
MNDKYQPPCTIAPEIVSLVADISQTLGRLSVQAKTAHSMRLRRVNRIRTVQGSLAIEGNTLSTRQITAILEGKTVIAPPDQIQEARNALLAYERMASWNPTRLPDLLVAHALMMAGSAS